MVNLGESIDLQAVLMEEIYPHDRGDYLIKTLPVPIRCFICDVRIMPGEIHVIREDERICLTCGLPARRLRPIGTNAARAVIK